VREGGPGLGVIVRAEISLSFGGGGFGGISRHVLQNPVAAGGGGGVSCVPNTKNV